MNLQWAPWETPDASSLATAEINAATLMAASVYYTMHKEHQEELISAAPPREKDRFVAPLCLFFQECLSTESICEYVHSVYARFGARTNAEKCQRTVGFFVEHPMILVNVLTRFCSEDSLLKFLQKIETDPPAREDFILRATQSFGEKYIDWQLSKECAFCGNTHAAKRCANCFVQYCNRDCQKAHWKTHKKICGLVMIAGPKKEEDMLQLAREVRGQANDTTSTS